MDVEVPGLNVEVPSLNVEVPSLNVEVLSPNVEVPGLNIDGSALAQALHKKSVFKSAKPTTENSPAPQCWESEPRHFLVREADG